ncbi:MAG TPA: AtpZ/AtpI family protein [Terriglobales bacterium]|nr:AtpZ/AtpI family protein [Terriglobales bacterium]
MPDESPTGSEPPKKRAKDAANQTALAMELPFTFVGAILLAGAVGYFLDHWLHTGPWLMMVFGALGFYAGVREVLRRLPQDPSGNGKTHNDGPNAKPG